MVWVGCLDGVGRMSRVRGGCLKGLGRMSKGCGKAD